MTKSFENRDGLIWLNGEFIEWKNAKAHIISQGLHYASAVFEGERAYNGKIFKYNEHTIRFFKSAEIIGMKLPYSEEEINLAKVKLKSSFLISNQTLDEILQRRIQLIGYDLNADFDLVCFKNIEDIFSEDIFKITNKYFSRPFLSVYGKEKICNEINELWIKNF